MAKQRPQRREDNAEASVRRQRGGNLYHLTGDDFLAGNRQETAGEQAIWGNVTWSAASKKAVEKSVKF